MENEESAKRSKNKINALIKKPYKTLLKMRFGMKWISNWTDSIVKPMENEEIAKKGTQFLSKTLIKPC